MVSVQSECSIDAALVLIENAAQSTGRTVEQIATSVVDRRLRFTPQP